MQRIPEPPFQQHMLVALPLRPLPIRRKLRPKDDLIAEVFKPAEHLLLDHVFVDLAHGYLVLEYVEKSSQNRHIGQICRFHRHFHILEILNCRQHSFRLRHSQLAGDQAGQEGVAEGGQCC